APARPEAVVAAAALNDQQKCPGLPIVVAPARPEAVVAAAALNDQQKCPGLPIVVAPARAGHDVEAKRNKTTAKQSPLLMLLYKRSEERGVAKACRTPSRTARAELMAPPPTPA